MDDDKSIGCRRPHWPVAAGQNTLWSTRRVHWWVWRYGTKKFSKLRELLAGSPWPNLAYTRGEYPSVARVNP